MRLQSSHSMADRDRDRYMSPPCAIRSLMAMEQIPREVWEPCCGDCTGMVDPLRAAGRMVRPSDIDPNFGQETLDYLAAAPMEPSVAVITNPPFAVAFEMLQKAISESRFVAFLLRTNFLESVDRMPFFKAAPPSRVWIASRRLPMMHREGWTGRRTSSNTCYAWFVYDAHSSDSAKLDWFDHQTVGRLDADTAACSGSCKQPDRTDTPIGGCPVRP
jgi:hypothetical protein